MDRTYLVIPEQPMRQHNYSACFITLEGKFAGLWPFGNIICQSKVNALLIEYPHLFIGEFYSVNEINNAIEINVSETTLSILEMLGEEEVSINKFGKWIAEIMEPIAKAVQEDLRMFLI
jgi:hypothetical protein